MGGLARLFRFKKSNRLMLTVNIDIDCNTDVNIDDRLVNGQLGAIVDVREDSSGVLSTIYVKFEDQMQN